MRKDTQRPCSENGTAKKKKYSFYFMFPPIGDFDHDSMIKIVELDIPSYPFKQIPSGNHRHFFFKQEKIKQKFNNMYTMETTNKSHCYRHLFCDLHSMYMPTLFLGIRSSFLMFLFIRGA